MIGTAAKSGKYMYYECDNRFKKGKDSCIGLRLGKEMVENSVLEKIQENIFTKENLTKLVHLINGELLETAGRLEKQLEQTERELARLGGKLTKLYVALESGKLDMDDLAPRIKELRAYQHELQQQRDSIIGRIESDEPEKLDEGKVTNFVNELEQVLGEKSFLQQKAFLRRFVKRIELNPQGFVLDYAIPLPADNNRTSTREVLYFNKDGSAYRICRNCASKAKYMFF
jgi:hypothetical protein